MKKPIIATNVGGIKDLIQDNKTGFLIQSGDESELIKKILSINSNEFTTSYRGFNLKKLDNFSLKNVSSRGYSFFMETVYQIHSRGFVIKQIPIHFTDRKAGKSKIPKIELFRTLFNVLKLKFKIWSRFKNVLIAFQKRLRKLKL